MRLSLNWLQDYIDTSDISAGNLADKLALTGTEVENIYEEAAGLDKVVVALIKKIRPHPNANRLVLCDVYSGAETLQIVCGAKNMKEGDKVALTLPGARLPSGMEVKKTNIRGEDSAGMLASDVELGLGEEASGHAYRQAGIMILDEKLTLGTKLADAFGYNDTILELEITPNRPDCMSMIGMAREIGAVLGRSYSFPEIKLSEENKKASEVADVKIEATDLCPRYIAKIMTGVSVGESVDWIKKRLLAAGARPINNLVDITNYVLFETGQPLHAFDYELLENGQIIVRRAKAGEKIITLDDVERTLTTDNLIIADKSRAAAIAGVMGGADTEVNDKTNTVLLESAYFNPMSVGLTSRSLGLISESSIRFERGVDPNGTDFAADRAAQLIQQVAGGKVLKGSVDVYPKPIKNKKLRLRPIRANSIIGIDLKTKEIADILSSLDLEVNLTEDSSLSQRESRRDIQLEVGVPTFRTDIEREIDLIEEIARLHGLNKIKATLPGVAQVGKVTELDRLQDKIRNQMVGFGLKEAITYSFIDSAWLKDYPDKLQKAAKLKNPLSAEQSVLRTTLLPGLLACLKLNVTRDQKNTQLFEIGAVFMPAKGVPDEEKHLGVILSGSFNGDTWYNQASNVDYFSAKGIVEAIFSSLMISESLNFLPYENKIFNPQKSFKLLLAEVEVGFIGELHPSYLEANDLPVTAYIELDIGILLKLNKQLAPFKGISAYPAIVLDVALLLDNKIKHSEVVRSIKEMGHELLSDIKLFDIYEGKGIEPGKKSMAYSLTYQSMERTLELAEVQKIHNSILNNLKSDLAVVVR